MVVPGLLRWITAKYYKITQKCRIPENDEHETPITDQFEIDNLYVDVAGVVYYCNNPRRRTKPKDEDELVAQMCCYLDRIFDIVRPRRLVYLAMDGVAPMVRVNSMRAQRYLDWVLATNAAAKHEATREQMRDSEATLPPPRTEVNPANMVPGTSFMHHLGDTLRCYIHNKKNRDPAWMDVNVSLSDTDVPGEGRHKIFELVRQQCREPDHDPGTSHCVFGEDDELILRALTTHQVKFVVMMQRHDHKDVTQCQICLQYGHSFLVCKKTSNDSFSTEYIPENNFYYLRIDKLRSQLFNGLFMDNISFPFDLERAIDDWVVLTFFLGNDIIPGLPQITVVDGALSRMIGVYKNTVRRRHRWLSDKGFLDGNGILLFLRCFAVTMDKFTRLRLPRSEMDIAKLSSSEFFYQREGNYEDLYYKNGFNQDSLELRRDVASQYLRGFTWAALYYFQGCPDWEWHNPYAYPPLIKDFRYIEMGHVVEPFDANTAPMRPLKQLMCVLHPSDSHLLPDELAKLMTDPWSPIAHFYSSDFKINVTTKRTYQEGVVELPIIDLLALEQAMNPQYNRYQEEPQTLQNPQNPPNSDWNFEEPAPQEYGPFNCEIIEEHPPTYEEFGNGITYDGLEPSEELDSRD